MRNLTELLSQTNKQARPEGGNITAFCRDGDGDNLFFTTSKGELIGLYGNKNDTKGVETIHLVESGLIQENSEILGIEYIPDLESVCIAANTGEIVLYSVETKEAECVGVIDSGLTSMNWSPDYEIVAFTTGNETVLLMTKEWDVLVENPIVPNSSNPSKDPKELEYSVSWRGDGQFFAVNSFDSKLNKRILRVFDRSATLSSSSEALSGLHNVLFWKPSGQLIASYQTSAQKEEIVFFERNGLRHGEFSMREKGTKVQKMKWNADSDVLALLVSVEGKPGNRLQLWSSSNYHWFLKQEIFLTPEEEIVDFHWDPEIPLLFRFVSNLGNYCEKLYFWEYLTNQTLNESNSSLTAVIDGNQINFTPFRFLVIPPPMFHSSLSFPSSIKEFSFGGQNNNLVLLSDHSLYVTSSPSTRDPPVILSQLKMSKAMNGFRQVTMCGNNRVIGIIAKGLHSETIVDFTFDETDFQVKEIFLTDFKQKIMRIHYSPNSLKIFIESKEGQLFEYIKNANEEIADLKTVQFHANSSSSFPSPCVKFATTVIGGKESFVGLDARGKLYVDSQLISGECSSFSFHNKFLIYTTSSNLLKFIMLETPIPNNISELKSTSANSREVERGSKLVAVVPNDFKVILQMPRGNLEAIYPTILIVDSLKQMFNNLEYQKAFILMRKHRIDVNFFYDYNPQLFLSNIRLFVEQVNNPDHFNLFLSGLKGVDVTTTLYQDNLNPKPYSVDSNKVNLLCDKMREHLQAVNPQKFLMSILTTYVKKDPPQLEEVLEVVRTLRDQEEQVDVTAPPPPSSEKKITAEEALKYICWLVEVDKLYDIALGTYDFGLVMMVAQKSQKDPKEYLPYLSHLQSMEKYIQRYTIDIQLGRFEKALFNLSKAGENHFEECLQLTIDKNLYESAIAIYAEEKEHLYAVTEAYGDYLSGQTYYPEAALLYQNCEKDAKAMQAYKNGGDWKMTMALAIKLGKSKEELSDLAYEIAESFRSVSRFTDAALLFFEYCNDVDQGITCLIEGNEFQEAYRRCFTHNRKELIETSLQMGVLESFESNRALIEKWHGKWIKKSERLKVVQTNKLLMPMLDQSGVPISDDARSMMSGMSSYSAASAFSGVSGMSGLSRASSTSGITIMSGQSLLSKGSRRGKPKQQRRKRVTGKEGGPHEEEFLIEYLKRIIPTAKFQEDIGNLTKMLLIFNHRSKAADIQALFQKYFELVKSNLTQLIPVEPPIPLNDLGQPLTEEQKKKKKEENLAKEASKILPRVDWKLKMFENA